MIFNEVLFGGKVGKIKLFISGMNDCRWIKTVISNFNLMEKSTPDIKLLWIISSPDLSCTCEK